MRLNPSRPSSEHPLPPAEPSADSSPPLPLHLFAGRRERVLESIGNGVLVLAASATLFKSRDTEVRYRQDSNFYYLTGFGEPDAVAVLTPHDVERRFTLFVRPRDPEREVWVGRRAGVEGAISRFGADAAYPLDELEDHLHALLEPAERIVYPFGSSAALDGEIMELLLRFRRSRQRSGIGPTALEDADALLGEMRVIKDAEEVDAIRTAARISAAGHGAAIAAARAGMGEWELEAILDSTFRRAGGAGAAYPSIVGSGANATTLHYVTNDRRLRDGDLVLMDAGAEWGMYCGDISRTFPVSGRFTPPQRALYDLVLAAENAAIDAVRPGALFSDIHNAALVVLVEGMIELGLLQGESEELIAEGAHRRFFMHQTSHWLGLDVHDVGLYARAGESVRLQPGMVMTVEPGIYIPEDADDVPGEFRGIGIRIEDDVLVTSDGHEVLTRAVPVDAEEIEDLVGSDRRRHP